MEYNPGIGLLVWLLLAARNGRGKEHENCFSQCSLELESTESQRFVLNDKRNLRNLLQRKSPDILSDPYTNVKAEDVACHTQRAFNIAMSSFKALLVS